MDIVVITFAVVKTCDGGGKGGKANSPQTAEEKGGKWRKRKEGQVEMEEREINR